MSEKTTDGILERHRRYMAAPMTYYEEPLVVESARGLVVTGADGKEYLDFFGGILTVSVEHCNETINAAIAAQNNQLQHISTLYPTQTIVDLAETLARITPGRLRKSFFTCSGSEADETAVMLAVNYTGCSELIALRHGYSGRTCLGQSLTAHSSWRILPTTIPGIKHAHNAYCYRCPFGRTYPACDVKCAHDIEDLIQTTTTGRIAGLIAEPIQGIGGFIVPPREYLTVAVDIVRKYGGVFICDEVQTGFGRTGQKMFGVEHWDVEPDIMTMAKGIANGIPLGATVATPEIADSIKGLTISTFGGNPVSCAAASATIDFIERNELAKRAYELGAVLRDGLEALKERFAVIGDVRGMGLMQGIELVVDEPAGDRTPNRLVTARLFEATRKRGLLIGKGGLLGNIVRVAPPLNVSRSQVDEALRTLEYALSDVTE